MLNFRLRRDARDWFKDLRDQKDFGRVDFNPFYFCFIAGVITGSKTDSPNDETAELVNYFPDRYNLRQQILVGLFLTAELKMLDISMDEKREVHLAISRFVMPSSPSSLSNEGVTEFNKYAHGGFDELLNWFEDRPRSLETFLLGFHRKIQEYANKGEIKL